jgi:hypothetical protein
MRPRWGSTPRLTDGLTVSRNVTLTLTSVVSPNLVICEVSGLAIALQLIVIKTDCKRRC